MQIPCGRQDCCYCRHPWKTFSQRWDWLIPPPPLPLENCYFSTLARKILGVFTCEADWRLGGELLKSVCKTSVKTDTIWSKHSILSLFSCALYPIICSIQQDTKSVKVVYQWFLVCFHTLSSLCKLIWKLNNGSFDFADKGINTNSVEVWCF